MIFEREESEESTRMLRIGRDYDSPRRSPEARPGSPSPEKLVNTSIQSFETSAKRIPSVIQVNLGNLVNNPSSTLMAGIDVRLPTFSGNGTEDPE